MKPAYAIPSVAEILAQEPTGLTVISTFSGAGGSCLGYRWAGYTVVWASEFIPAARDTYRANFPDAILDERDIRTVAATDIFKAPGLGGGEVDILEGSPPCASFSLAGQRDKTWGEVKPYSDTKQRTDDLFGEWTRLVKDVQPRVCIAENVPALATGTAVGYFKQVTRAIAEAGYTVKAVELDAQWLGVPQRRKRLFIIGVRSDLRRSPAFPKPLSYWYSIRDAIPDIEGEIEHASGFESFKRDRRGSSPPGHAWYSTNQPAETVFASKATRVRGYAPRFDEQAKSSEPYAIYDEWKKLEYGGQSQKYFNLVKSDPDQAAQTITQLGGNPSAASITHPTEPRKFTIPELKRICGFPDDFTLTGSYPQQYERLGRAVCPPVTKAIGDTIRARVLT